MAEPIEATEPTQADVKDATTIAPEALQEEFVRLPGDLAYWNGQYARWQHRTLEAEHHRKVTEARVRLEVKAAATSAGEKVNESIIDARVETDDRLIEAKGEEIKAEGRKAFAYGVVDAIRAKRDSLISLGAHMRADREQALSIREESRRR